MQMRTGRRSCCSAAAGDHVSIPLDKAHVVVLTEKKDGLFFDASAYIRCEPQRRRPDGHHARQQDQPWRAALGRYRLAAAPHGRLRQHLLQGREDDADLRDGWLPEGRAAVLRQSAAGRAPRRPSSSSTSRATRAPAWARRPLRTSSAHTSLTAKSNACDVLLRLETVADVDTGATFAETVASVWLVSEAIDAAGAKNTPMVAAGEAAGLRLGCDPNGYGTYRTDTRTTPRGTASATTARVTGRPTVRSRCTRCSALSAPTTIAYVWLAAYRPGELLEIHVRVMQGGAMQTQTIELRFRPYAQPTLPHTAAS
jgi:hypothetical protein